MRFFVYILHRNKRRPAACAKRQGYLGESTSAVPSCAIKEGLIARGFPSKERG